jgi:large subunit ribosomal protein L18e
LSRRTGSSFDKVVLKRLCMSRTNRPVLSLSAICKFSKGIERTVVVVGTVTNDERLQTLPEGLSVCALRFTGTARQRIVEAGGKAMSFDQLAIISPKGENTLLLRGKKTAREAVRHFGVPGRPGSHVKPYVRSKGRKFEKAK